MLKYILITLLLSPISIARDAQNIEKIPFTFYSLGSATKKETQKEKNTEKLIFQMIVKSLPEYEFSFKTSNYTTAHNNIVTSKNVCLRNIVKTQEREKSFLFSKPQTLFLGLRLYFSPHIAPLKIQELNKLSLFEIFKSNTDLVIGIEKGRAYGDELTYTFDQLPSRNKYYKVGSDGQNLMIYMLLEGRIDMMLEYPEVMEYKKNQLSQNTELYSTSLPKTAPLVFGRIACSKSELSSQLIDKVNKILTQIYDSKEYKEAHLELIKDKNQMIFNKLYSDFLNNIDTESQ